METNQKALKINLDSAVYGTFAEIGAGQEVARHFFQAGGASGTIAETISAYDMNISNAIYGVEKSGRYVSESRLEKMLDHEFANLESRLHDKRSVPTNFFVFANTAAAKSYNKANECHGWIGVRFQTSAGSAPNDVIIHVRMLEKENLAQQATLGVVGVNLLFGCCYHWREPEQLIKSLVDNLAEGCIEIDMIRFRGPDFGSVDNRLICLELVKNGLTDAVMFNQTGDVIQPSEVLYKKPVLAARGSFRPVTLVNVDMMKNALAQFRKETDVGDDAVVLAEITLNNLLSGGKLDEKDFLARVDILAGLGFNVLISNYQEYYRLASFFSRYTKRMIGIVLGVGNLVEIFKPKYYEDLEGGILESFGILFSRMVKLYVYPMKDPTSGTIINCGNLEENLNLEGHVTHLYRHLRENGFLTDVSEYDDQVLQIFSREVLTMIKDGIPGWEKMLPDKVPQMIKDNRLFGYTGKKPQQKAG